MGRVPERGSKTKKHKWTRKEDEALISSLTELCQTGWKRENNIFKNGYTTVLEKELKSKLPGCNLKASPHIESRLKTLKKHCDAITDMKDASGIQWRNTDYTLICYDDDVWDNWVKDHSDAKGLRNKPFPYYDDLYQIFGKNRGNHKIVEDNRTLDVYEISENINGHINPVENNDSNHEDGNVHKCDEIRINDSNDDDVLRTPLKSPQLAYEKKDETREIWSSGMQSLAKIVESLLKRNEEQFSVLTGLISRDMAADKAAADKRVKLNGELKRIPNLSLQARLRAASIIVGDSGKLDLFYSFSNEERKEWVSMLLSGLI